MRILGLDHMSMLRDAGVRARWIYARRRAPNWVAGWQAALADIEHQARHWETPEHGETGQLIAAALRSSVDIARTGGLACDKHAWR